MGAHTVRTISVRVIAQLPVYSMLDRKFILENPQLVAENCRRRGVDVDVPRFIELETARRAKQLEVEQINRQANEVSKSISKARDDAQREASKAEGRRLRELVAQAQAEADRLAAEVDQLHKRIPNLTHPDAPLGGADASREVGRGKVAPPNFDFKPLDHVQLGERLNLLDFEGGAKVAGHGFYFLKNDAVLLELALQQFAVNTLIAEGFTPTITPDLARNEILEGIGFIPRGPETQIYSIDGSDLSLVATAEITLGGLLSGETLDADQLPVRVCGISHCYRTEAGAHGRATRGLYRVHQFTKVEMFAFTLPDQSDETLEYFRALECRIFDDLGLAYRVIDTAAGDLGGPAYRKYDLEAWMPGRGEAGEFGEVTSTSNCTDYQARRLNIRYKLKGEKGTHFVHTLNGTAVACSRAILAILENYQQADGSVVVPEVLRPYMGKDRIGPA
jgi:seryl-tRNA synthetase